MDCRQEDDMQVFSEKIKFKGTWRPYQKRVLDNLNNCLDDRKVHIVAAPGSGKTTLGLELILRMGSKALILSPSITIREQWIERFKSGFLPDDEKAETWLSNDLKDIRPITCITYQALYSAYTQKADTASLETDDNETEDQEKYDFSSFDLIEVLKKEGISTICLDECHHLRSEWWKSLEYVLGELGTNIRTIALTATPPYDSTPGEWDRYLSLCGEIDEEIFVPELVNEDNLCPHQDYVYFNFPTGPEIDAIKNFKENVRIMFKQLSESPELLQAVSHHRGLADIEGYQEQFLDNPKYFFSILIFLNHHGCRIDPKVKRLTGTRSNFPALDVKWLEILLQGFLFDDASSYPESEDLQERINWELTNSGLITRRVVYLQSNDKLNKLLMTSLGKLNSIADITKAELGTMKNDLRLLILTDYIKKESLSLLGNMDKSITTIGALPIFEMLRRASLEGLKLTLLTGSLVIIPSSVKEELDMIAQHRNLALSYRETNVSDYVEVATTGLSKKQLVAMVTELFEKGSINAVVGTKSLLGEGWDSPSINTLIMASFIGSYMLSNQMRGRAIRISKDNPQKVANIWHLVCMEPYWAYADDEIKRVKAKLSDRSHLNEEPVSDDYRILSRRFKSFLGVHYDEDLIEDGISRLTLIKPPYNGENIKKINEQMIDQAMKREELQERWKRSLKKTKDVSQIVDMNLIDKKEMPRKFTFYNKLVEVLLATITIPFITQFNLGPVLASKVGILGFVIYYSVIIFLLYVMVRAGIVMFRFLTPQKEIKHMGIALVKALKKADVIRSYNARPVTREEDALTVSSYLEGGTTYEKNVYSKSIFELLGAIDNPRYLLVKRINRIGSEYYQVPSILAKNKETAEALLHCMNEQFGLFALVFTRNAWGRRMLLKARKKAFGNINDNLYSRKKRLNSKWR
jgi:superfamily II DNA or RNA helicase